MNKLEALARFLECEVNEVECMRYDDNAFENGREEYLVLTDNEADEYATKAILDSVWAFRASFLEAHISDLDESCIQKIQELCEDANPVLLKLLNDKAHFVDDAVLSDGRGHFIGQYDFEEHEQGEYFIYRLN
jgi:hypothetical protein